MGRKVITLLAAAAVLALAVPDAKADYCGVTRLLHRRCGSSPCGSGCEYQCYTVMKTVMRTVFEPVPETRERTVFDTVWDCQTVQDVRKVSQLHYRQETFSYQRAVYQTQTREVPYTVNIPVCETRSKDVSCLTYVPSYETRTRSISCTTYNPVQETSTRTIQYCVPRCVSYTRTISVPSGHWETRMVPCPSCVSRECTEQSGCCERTKYICQRVWIPSVEQREVTCYKTVYDMQSREVPYTVTRLVAQTHTREVPYTVTRMVPVTNTRTVYYQTTRMVSEQRVKTVCSTVKQLVPETGVRTVPYTTVQEVPVTRTVTVPRQVPRTVHYTVTNYVPRTICCQIPVRICCPVAGCADRSGGCCDRKDNGAPYDAPLPPVERNEAPLKDVPVEQQPVEKIPAVQTTSLQTQITDQTESRKQFVTGLNAFWAGQYEGATAAFQDAKSADPTNAKCAYFLALSHYRAGRMSEAEQALTAAVELERHVPIADWGRSMERIQGAERLWLENARRPHVAKL